MDVGHVHVTRGSGTTPANEYQRPAHQANDTGVARVRVNVDTAPFDEIGLGDLDRGPHFRSDLHARLLPLSGNRFETLGPGDDRFAIPVDGSGPM